MGYRVIEFFTDLQDGGHPYEAGSAYPREGADATEGRIAELLGGENLQGKSLIAEVAPESSEPKKAKAAKGKREPEASAEEG